jgi:hypothetical protein
MLTPSFTALDPKRTFDLLSTVASCARKRPCRWAAEPTAQVEPFPLMGFSSADPSRARRIALSRASRPIRYILIPQITYGGRRGGLNVLPDICGTGITSS